MRCSRCGTLLDEGHAEFETLPSKWMSGVSQMPWVAPFYERSSTLMIIISVYNSLEVCCICRKADEHTGRLYVRALDSALVSVLAQSTTAHLLG